MPGRPPIDTRIADLRALHQAARIAHGSWDPRVTDTRPLAVFREFGRFRWLVLPIAAFGFAFLVWLVELLVSPGGLVQ